MDEPACVISRYVGCVICIGESIVGRLTVWDTGHGAVRGQLWPGDADPAVDIWTMLARLDLVARIFEYRGAALVREKRVSMVLDSWSLGLVAHGEPVPFDGVLAERSRQEMQWW